MNNYVISALLPLDFCVGTGIWTTPIHIYIFLSLYHIINHPIIVSFSCLAFHPLSLHPPLSYPWLLSCLTCFKFTFFQFLTLVSRVVPLHPLSLHPVFHVCRLSLFSPSFSVFLSLPLLCWSLWLILKGNCESEWDLKEREELCSTQQGRPSLDWNAARKKTKQNITHGRGELFPLSPFLFPPPLYSSLSSLLSCLISYFYSPSAGARI